MKKLFLIMLIIMLTFLVTDLFGNDMNNSISDFSVGIIPGGSLPVGGSSGSFSFGGGGEVTARYFIPGLFGSFVGINVGYNYMAIKASDSVSVIPFGATVGMIYVPIPGVGLTLDVFGGGGGYYGFLNSNSSVSALGYYGEGGGGIGFFVTPNISISLLGSYEYYSGLYDGVKFVLGTSYYLGKVPSIGVKPVRKAKPSVPKPAPLKKDAKKEEKVIGIEGLKHVGLKNVKFYDIFPVFFKYYDTHPVGSVVVKNISDKDVKDVTVSLYVKQYMDTPKVCAKIGVLKGKEEKRVDLKALFTEKVLEITEGTKVAAEVMVKYSYGGKEYRGSVAETVRLYDRNATQWDDNRKAAAFVTAKDPAVLKFSKNIAGLIKGKGSRAVNKNLRMAMGIHEALSLYGLSYVVDPKTPYKDYSKNKQAVDFLQFPRQTLEYRAGDCDDLSILTCSLMEAVGIETAFITIPGHIFMAFSLDMSASEARKSFLRADELIFGEGKVWVPVEVTMIGGGFLKAWQEGAKEWREAVAKEVAGFYPMHKAWKVYEPVGLPGTSDVSLPDRDKIEIAYLNEVTRFIDRQIYPRVAKLQGEINRSGGAPRSINKLGVLYARYGLYDRAKREFNRILKKDSSYVPALINLGNLYYLSGDIKGALKYYNRAYKIEPDNAKVLLCVARANHEIENYGTVREVYGKLKAINPDLAMRFSYLDLRGEEASRAASMAEVKEVVIWEEE